MTTDTFGTEISEEEAARRRAAREVRQRAAEVGRQAREERHSVHYERPTSPGPSGAKERVQNWWNTRQANKEIVHNQKIGKMDSENKRIEMEMRVLEKRAALDKRKERLNKVRGGGGLSIGGIG